MTNSSRRIVLTVPHDKYLAIVKAASYLGETPEEFVLDSALTDAKLALTSPEEFYD